MGFVMRPNQSANKLDNDGDNQEAKPSLPNVAIELMEIPDKNEGKPSIRAQFPLTKADEGYIMTCLARYGVNYAGMFRDISVNNMQYTEHQLEKMGSKFLSLSPEQRQHTPFDELPVSLQLLVTSQQQGCSDER
jgi:Ribosome biogenesis protein Nop16